MEGENRNKCGATCDTSQAFNHPPPHRPHDTHDQLYMTITASSLFSERRYTRGPSRSPDDRISHTDTEHRVMAVELL